MKRKTANKRTMVVAFLSAALSFVGCAQNEPADFDYYSRENAFADQFWGYVETSGIRPNWHDASMSDLENVTYWFPFAGEGPYTARVTCMDLAMEKIVQDGRPRTSDVIGKSSAVIYWTRRHHTLCREHGEERKVLSALHMELAELNLVKSEKIASAFGEY